MSTPEGPGHYIAAGLRAGAGDVWRGKEDVEHGRFRPRPIELGPVKPLPVRCRDCRRVRFLPTSASRDWEAHPEPLEREVSGQCATCATAAHLAAERKRAAEGRKLRRDRERGYGEAPEGEDVFAGFRGDRG